jgi:DNA-binding SARP family transcriptional activator
MLPNADRLINGEDRADWKRDVQPEIPGAETVDQLIALGIEAVQTGNLVESAEHLFQAVNLSRQNKDSVGLTRSLQNLVAHVFLLRGEFALALTRLEEIINIYASHQKKDWISHLLRAFIYQTIGDRTKCIRELDELLPLVRTIPYLSTAYLLIWSRLSVDDEQMERASEYLHMGLRAASQSDYSEMILMFQVEFSRFYRLQNEPAVAHSWTNDALRLANHGRSSFYTAIALLERAQTLWMLQDTASAENDLLDAIQIFDSLRAVFYRTQALFVKAIWYHQAGRPEAPQAWLEVISAITRNGYAFMLQKEQERAFPLLAFYLRSRSIEVRKATEKLLEQLAQVSPPPLRVVALGQFAVWKGNHRIPDSSWSKRKSGELFRYLLLQPNRTAIRDMIIEALWPDSLSEKPSDLLHQSTSALRHILEPDLPDKFPSRYLRVEGETITLILPPGSQVDFEAFENLLSSVLQSSNTDRLNDAIKLYNGDLFPADRYNDWSEEQREVLRELYKRALLALAKAYYAQEQYFPVINCCRQVLKIDSWSEDAVLLSMQAYAGLQDVPHALQIYRNLEQTLKEDLNIAPRPDLQKLALALAQR